MSCSGNDGRSTPSASQRPAHTSKSRLQAAVPPAEACYRGRCCLGRASTIAQAGDLRRTACAAFVLTGQPSMRPVWAALGPQPGRERPERLGQARRTRGTICPAQEPFLAEHLRPRPQAVSLSHGGSRLGLDLRLCRNGHAWASAVTYGHMGSSSRSPIFRLNNWDAASLRSPRSLTFRGSAAENRREKRTYPDLRNSAPDWTESPAPNPPNTLHITHQPDQETAWSSHFAWRSRVVKTSAFLTGPNTTGGEAS
jgi:hypothetical protein